MSTQESATGTNKTGSGITGGTGTAPPGAGQSGAGGAPPRKQGGTWGAPSPLGHYTALQSAGGIAAPLLAGFSFTMTSVLLTSPGTSRWQNATLALFVSAGLILIFTVQTSLWLQSYAATPSDYSQWYPEKMVNGYPDSEAFQWHIANATKAGTYAKATRRLYNFGILVLLAAVATAVIPPGPIAGSRIIVVVVGCAGFVAELIWILASERKRRTSGKSRVPSTAGWQMVLPP